MPEPFTSQRITTKPYLHNKREAITRMNTYGRTKTPFFFLISYDTTKTILIRTFQPSQEDHIRFTFPEYSNHPPDTRFSLQPGLVFDRPSSVAYARQYQLIQQEFQKGNIYLLNLTHSTPIRINASLKEIYQLAKAKYKVIVPDRFVVFSPETFVKITGNKIYTYPMKGTIRADLPEALNKLREDRKEQAEHASVVDLLRNDLGQVSKAVKVNRYRYFEKIQAGKHELWQASSEIEGDLHKNFLYYLGDLIFTLLPAGSISGVPKKNAVEIIGRIENHDRGFYTGICGYFDGKNLDSAVMIRFIEQTPDGLVYKSGGGIHHMSNMKNEYQELIEKIYVPVD